MTATVYSEKNTVGDLIRYEGHQDYTRKAITVYNRSGAAMTIANPIGYPILADTGQIGSASVPAVAGAYCFAKHGDEASVVALHADEAAKSISLAINASVVINALVRGPAIVDKAVIPTTDYAGTGFTLATIVTAIQALNPPILAGAENTSTYTQTL